MNLSDILLQLFEEETAVWRENPVWPTMSLEGSTICLPLLSSQEAGRSEEVGFDGKMVDMFVTVTGFQWAAGNECLIGGCRDRPSSLVGGV